MQNYYNTFKKVFEQESLKKAIEYVTFLKVEVNKFPKFLADIFKSKFLMNIKSSYIFLNVVNLVDISFFFSPLYCLIFYFFMFLRMKWGIVSGNLIFLV